MLTAQAIRELPELLTTRQAADLLGYSENTLRCYRSRGPVEGQATLPESFALSPRKVVYRKADCLAWLRDRGV